MMLFSAGCLRATLTIAGANRAIPTRSGSTDSAKPSPIRAYIEAIEVIELKVKKLHPDATIPSYATDGAGCFDLHALITNDDDNFVCSGMPLIISTGLAFEVPKGWVMKIYSRSGHGFNQDIRLGNCVGIIDSDFRGPVKVKLTRDGESYNPIQFKHGDRIAQAMLEPAPQVRFVEYDELSETARGTGGFGSTGN